MISFDKIKPGDVLYDVHRTKMGNTRMSRLGCWTVRIIRLEDHDSILGPLRGAVVSWNSNSEQWWPQCRIAKLRRSPPKSDPLTPGRR